jgi:hypothetical protein
MNANATKGAARRTRAASAALYAPKPKALVASPRPVVDMALRRLTAQVLDELKVPGAIPSQVIYAALERAKRG